MKAIDRFVMPKGTGLLRTTLFSVKYPTDCTFCAKPLKTYSALAANVGAADGAAVGAIVSKLREGANVGAVVGAAVGAAVGSC